MKTKRFLNRCDSAFTLAEIMVTTGMAAVVGVCASYIFLNGTSRTTKTASR